jgi:hypothetical protein
VSMPEPEPSVLTICDAALGVAVVELVVVMA